MRRFSASAAQDALVKADFAGGVFAWYEGDDIAKFSASPTVELLFHMPAAIIDDGREIANTLPAEGMLSNAVPDGMIRAAKRYRLA